MISTKGRYALRVMLDLASRKSDEFVPLKDVAERQDISKKYLEIIAKELVKGGILTGASGKHGGYKLARSADEITVGEVIKLMEGTIAPVACLSENAQSCPRKESCKTINMWEELYKIEYDYLYSKKISDLLNT